MTKNLLLVGVLLTLVVAQEYLPKVSGYLPMNDINARNVARSGRKSYWKTEKDEASTIISAYPIRPNAVTKVSFYLENGYRFNIGVGEKDIGILKTTGNMHNLPKNVLIHTGNGRKYMQLDDGIEYATKFSEGDNITMTVDLRPYINEISYFKNGLPLGIAFSGLNDWKDLHIMVTLTYVNDRIKITDYSVEE